MSLVLSGVWATGIPFSFIANNTTLLTSFDPIRWEVCFLQNLLEPAGNEYLAAQIYHDMRGWMPKPRKAIGGN